MVNHISAASGKEYESAPVGFGISCRRKLKLRCELSVARAIAVKAHLERGVVMAVSYATCTRCPRSRRPTRRRLFHLINLIANRRAGRAARIACTIVESRPQPTGRCRSGLGRNSHFDYLRGAPSALFTDPIAHTLEQCLCVGR